MQTYPRHPLHSVELTPPHLLPNYISVLTRSDTLRGIEGGGTPDAVLLSGPSES